MNDYDNDDERRRTTTTTDDDERRRTTTMTTTTDDERPRTTTTNDDDQRRTTNDDDERRRTTTTDDDRPRTTTTNDDAGRHPRYSIQLLADTWSPYLTLPDSLANTQNPAPNPVPNCYLLINDSYITNQFFKPTKGTPFQGPKTRLINPPTTPRY